MNNINAFIKLIISLTFVYAIGENMLPDNSIKKYIGYVYGLMLLTTAVSLVAGIKDFDYTFIYSDTDSISVHNKYYLQTLYEDNLEDILRKKFGDESISVEMTSDYRIKSIKCGNIETYDEIMRYLNE